jgi:hypothetical protein
MLLYLEKPCQRNENDEGPDAHVRAKRPNDHNQRLATKGLSIPPDLIASSLHRIVRDALGLP